MNEVWQLRLDLKPMKWEQIVPLNENRWLTDVVFYRDTLVVVGGRSDYKVLSSGKCFVKVMNKWQAIPNLNCARSRHQLVVCDDFLYALGGWNATSILSSVKWLNSLANKWEYGEAMKNPRKWFAAVNYQNCIYVIGGKAEKGKALSTTEKYNPIKGQWTFVCKLNFARYSHTASVLQNKIFVVGGCNSTRTAVQEIECTTQLRISGVLWEKQISSYSVTQVWLCRMFRVIAFM